MKILDKFFAPKSCYPEAFDRLFDSIHAGLPRKERGAFASHRDQVRGVAPEDGRRMWEICARADGNARFGKLGEATFLIGRAWFTAPSWGENTVTLLGHQKGWKEVYSDHEWAPGDGEGVLVDRVEVLDFKELERGRYEVSDEDKKRLKDWGESRGLVGEQYSVGLEVAAFTASFRCDFPEDWVKIQVGCGIREKNPDSPEALSLRGVRDSLVVPCPEGGVYVVLGEFETGFYLCVRDPDPFARIYLVDGSWRLARDFELDLVGAVEWCLGHDLQATFGGKAA